MALARISAAISNAWQYSLGGAASDNFYALFSFQGRYLQMVYANSLRGECVGFLKTLKSV